MAGKTSGRGEASAVLRRHMATIRACERSGESLKSYAERRGLSPRTLYEAKRQARKRGLLPPHRAAEQGASRPSPERAKTRFVEATPSPMLARPGPTWRLRLPSGAVLEVATPLSIEDIVRLAERLGGAS